MIHICLVRDGRESESGARTAERGLFDEVRAVSDTEISQHPVLSECVQETILSLEFMPPEDGGTIVVSYPFVFRSHDEQ